MPTNGRYQVDGVWLGVKPLTGRRARKCLSMLRAAATHTSIEEQRLRRPLRCTPLTSGNEFPHTMIGGVSGTRGLIMLH